MSFFRRPHYRSEFTEFIDALKAAKPEIEIGQHAGRALLWDKNVDRAAWQAFREGEVPQKGYVHQTGDGS